ncbi:hypothetical protein IPF89_01580 [Candidatus Saccharibacteria bacterium]|nr:MAG: hypothetical protein IPF89_01580 [Candidatus Saccharibacteria bacterium]
MRTQPVAHNQLFLRRTTSLVVEIQNSRNNHDGTVDDACKTKNIRVYSLDPGVYNDATRQSDPNEPDTSFKEHETLKLYTIMTSGAYYRLSSVDVISDVVQKISQQEAKLFVGESQYTTTDTPDLVSLY